MSRERSKHRAGPSWGKALLTARERLPGGRARVVALLVLAGCAATAVVVTVVAGQGGGSGSGLTLVNPVVNAQVDVPAAGTPARARYPEPSGSAAVPHSAVRIHSGKAATTAPGGRPAAPGASAHPSAASGGSGAGPGAPGAVAFTYSPSGGTSPSALPSSSAPSLSAPATSAAPTPTIQPSSTQCARLTAGQELAAGQALLSCDSDYKLAMQSDGNLVLYQGATALWNTATNGSAADSVEMLADGDLVLSTASGSEVWDSGTAGNQGAYLALQSDGNLVIYTAGGAVLWDTATNGE